MMLANAAPVLVRAYPTALDFERRAGGERFTTPFDATTRPLDAQDTLGWGANVRDISRTGVGLTICFPFKSGTYLAVDLHGPNPNRPVTSILSRVVHSRDQNDGTWHVGCEFLKPLAEDEFEWLV